ncbi:hypothetical protein [Clostridium tyrobutyricum]|uniref:hypothetical protein n=1 Tax=Clostridium tyrobutyricum TaxID=1519 RepID=UPI00057F7E46|nr:hypothetical protein [Clostridium tyrobutyricum]
MENVRKIYSYTRNSENYDNENLNDKFDKLILQMEENYNEMNRKFDKLDKKMDAMDRKMDKLI